MSRGPDLLGGLDDISPPHRHTTATLLLGAGVDPHVLTGILGHSTVTTSRGYQHVSQDLARRALDDVATRLGWLNT